MWILVTILGICLMIGILIRLCGIQWGFFLVMVFVIGFTIISGYHASYDFKTQYTANVLYNNTEQGIYFNEFTQSGNTVVIPDYYVPAVHWTDFKLSDYFDKPITLHLIDGKQFDYTVIGKESKEPVKPVDNNTWMQK
jgi:hypothetical protein